MCDECVTTIDKPNCRCGPCKQIAPIYKELSDEYGSRAQFLKVDVDTVSSSQLGDDAASPTLS